MTIDYEGETFVSYGDHPRQKNAEAMASLCMLYILDGRDLVCAPPHYALCHKSYTFELRHRLQNNRS